MVVRRNDRIREEKGRGGKGKGREGKEMGEVGRVGRERKLGQGHHRIG